MISSSVDPELCFRHDRGELVLLMTRNMDDLKLTGEPQHAREVLAHLQNTFGKLKVTYNSFVNCGVQYTQHADTKEITLDQNKYSMNLTTIAHPQMTTGQPDDDACLELHHLYVSLFSSIVYLKHTRLDAVAFVRPLQQHMD